MKRLEDKVAIVTGGGGALGRATVLRLAQEGAAVAVADIAGDSARAVAEEVTGGGGTAVAIEVDLASEESIRNLIEATTREWGRLDVLHNNAAAVGRKQLKADQHVLEMDVETWDAAMTINARGPMLACKHAIPVMLETGGGSIVNTASLAGVRGDRVRTAYGCSKAALLTLTLYVASSYGKLGIRCNAISPGLIMNPAIAARRTAEELDAALYHYASPRLGTPDDIAALVAYLAADESMFVNGQNIAVDGAMSAHLPTMGAYV